MRQLAELSVKAWGTDIDEEKLERVRGNVADSDGVSVAFTSGW
jgi:hypothetical protein